MATSSRRAEALQQQQQHQQHQHYYYHHHHYHEHHHHQRRTQHTQHTQQKQQAAGNHNHNNHNTNNSGGGGGGGGGSSNTSNSSNHNNISSISSNNNAIHANNNNTLAAATVTNASLNANSVVAKHGQIIATQIRTRNSQNIPQQHSPARMKRPLDPIANTCDLPKSKRARIAVEILARPVSQQQPISPPRKSITVKPQLPTATTNEPAVASTHKGPPLPLPLPLAQQRVVKTATTTEPSLKKHKEKAINGIKHELDRLQPSAADASSATERPGRKLRSQEATRFKSELSAYFPDYDEVIGNDPKEQRTALESIQPPHLKTVRAYGDHLFTDLHDSQRIDFTFLEARYNGREVDDPLTDAYFEPAHKKAERLEKSIRNTEKGRAQHEKDQIIRLLNELQGHDWLRTMGVSGVTESRKKTFEPARDHFIKGCQAILEKFRTWSQEEKKRKLKKERALAEEAEENEGKEADRDGERIRGGGYSDDDEEMSDVEAEDNSSRDVSDDDGDGDPLDYSDVDASARQLHAEALARARYAASSSKRSRGEPPPKLPEPVVAKEFTSFFRKKHQRDAALSKGRRRGRTVVAWGHPIPDMMQYDFDLPEEYRDTDTLKAHERQKRRDRRQHKH
ncbi:hypothetical protein AAE478_009405 [Parahypoxylon ruwenzoriense]